MRRSAICAIALCVAMGLSLTARRGQAAQASAQPANPPTIANTLDMNLTIIEREFVGAAEAMPEAKYSFAPTTGEFKGVRTFAQEVRHVAFENLLYYGAILGQTPPEGAAAGENANGPESVATKAQIVQYLRDSFALGHKAIATITPENQLTLVKNPPVRFLTTPLALASWGPAHAFDHYGQVVEYLRMNGLVPPASQGRPPANPTGLRVQ